MPGTRTSAGPRVLLVFLGLAFASLLGELALRMIGFRQPALLTQASAHTYSTEPGATFVYRGYMAGTFQDFENTVTLNRFGMHDRDYDGERPTPATRRILVLGDSYVAALSVPLEATFHKRLEARLSSEDPFGAGSYEVIAFGMGHRAQRAQRNWLNEAGPEFKPNDVLLLFFCGNDVMENSKSLDKKAGDFARFYVNEIAPRKERIFRRLLVFPRSRLNGLLAETATTWYAAHLDRFVPGISAADLESPELGVYRHPPDAEWAEAFNTTALLLDTIRRQCNALGSRFLLASLEGPQAIGDAGSAKLWKEGEEGIDFKQPGRWVAGWCRTNGVPFCDVGPALAAAGRRNVFWRHDGHLNAKGNEVVASTLYDFVLRDSSAAVRPSAQ